MTIDIGILEERPFDRSFADAEKREELDTGKLYRERLESENASLRKEVDRLQKLVYSMWFSRLDVQA